MANERILFTLGQPAPGDELVRGLQSQGYSCLVFASGEDALAGIAPDAFDAAVIDARLPGMSGVELARALKDSAGEQVYLPVLLLGDSDAAEERVRGLRAGCDDVIGKPADVALLEVRLASLLERRRQRAELVRANEALRVAQERKRHLAALVVHDLRNPLAALLGNVELLGEELSSPSEGVAQILSDMTELGAKATSLISGLLDVEELEEGLLEARRELVRLADFAARFGPLYRTPLGARGLTLEVDVAPDASARFDPELVFRLVENLLDNAVRYARRGGRVTLRLGVVGESVRILVGNDGPPIPEDEAERIFGRYYRLEARRKGARANRGLGLYFCRLAAEAHGGTITAHSIPDFPACFEVLLPR